MTISSVEMEDHLQKFAVPGVSYVRLENFQIAESGSVGFADITGQRKVTPSTAFQCASLSKVITAFVIMKLVQEGKVELEQNVNTYLHSWKLTNSGGEPTEKVSLLHLLSHSGAVTIHGFPGYPDKENLPTLDQILNGSAPANTKKIVADGQPGEKYRYSGGGTLVIQKVIEEVTGEDFAAIAQRDIFAPLEMTESFFGFPSPEAAIALGYDLNKTAVPRAGFQFYPELAAAGLWSTPMNVAKLVLETQRTLQGNSEKILRRETLQKMLLPRFFTFMSSFTGLGFFLDSQKPEWFFHCGENLGYRCVMIGNLHDGSGLIAMTNAENGFEVIKGLTAGFPYGFLLNGYSEINISLSSAV